MYGKKMSEELKKKLIEINTSREYIFSKKHRESISTSLKGKKLSEEHVKSIIEGRKNGKRPSGTKVYADSDKEHLEFDSITKASEYFNVHRNRLYRNQIGNFKVTIKYRNK